MFAPISVRGMDGLVVCAMVGARRGRGFEPRFVRPSREVPATAPFSIPLHHRYRRWIGGVSRPHSFFSLFFFCFFVLMSRPHVLCKCTCQEYRHAMQKARHRAQHTYNNSAPRHWYRRPPGAASPPHIPFGGFELPSLGQQPAVQPLQYEAQNRHMCTQIPAIQCHGPFT